MQIKIPIECKASLRYKKKYSKNVLHYLKTTNQKAGVVVSAAPIERISTDDGFTIVTLPVYLATRSNIEKYIDY